MTFKQLYNKLITEAKEKHPNSELLKYYDISYNIAHLSVSEVFTNLDYGIEEHFKWRDDIDDMITDEVLIETAEEFRGYIKTVKDESI